MLNNEPLVIERLLNAPVERVWKAITDKQEMQKWYFKLEAFVPEAGFEFQFEGGSENKKYLHLCRITELVPGKKLTYSWRYEGYPGNSFVTFELFPEENKTRLKLTHAGLGSFPQDNPDFARTSFSAGWNFIIGKSLPEYVEQE